MASYSARYSVAVDTYTLVYSPNDNVPGFHPEGTFSDGEPVPEGVWTAFASPFMVDLYGGIGLVLVTESGQVFEFLAHQHPPAVDGIVFVPFVGHGSYLHLRIEHLEDGTIVFAHSTNLRDWTEEARFIPDTPVKEVGIGLRHDRDEQPATGQLAEVRLLTGLWTNAVEYVDLGEPDEPVVVEQRQVQAVQAGVTSTTEPLVHAIVGAQFGDLEFDVGKSVRWLDWYTDNLFILDVNLGTQRYWIVNWAETFPDAKHTVTGINYFVLPTEFRKEQWRQYKLAFGTPNDDEWIFFVDAHEGLSFDNRSLPDDYDFAPFRSFLWREIQRAQDKGEASAVLPFYVFLRSDNYTNVTYASDIVDPTGRAAVVEQTLSVPYYQAYRGVRRLWRASELKKASFDWALLDTMVDWDVQPGTGEPAAEAYLNPMIGTITTPDPGPLPGECTFVFKIRGAPTVGMIAAQYEDGNSDSSWALNRGTDPGQLALTVSPDGSWASGITRAFAGPLPTGSDEWLALSRIDNGTTFSARAHQSTDAGDTWRELGASASGQSVAAFDASTEMRIGAFSGGYGQVFNGRIYSVELRTGLDPQAGTVLWRFDASEYPGTGTSYTDPRGRVWTLAEASSILPAVPALPAVSTAKAQIISYGYAHWNIQDIPPGGTSVAPLTEANDDGWRMRILLSQVRPVPGIPIGDIWIPPVNDPAGLPGPWTPDDFMHSTPLDPATFQPISAPVASDTSLAGLITPLYDCVFRINLRDGVWYEEGNSGNIPLRWDDASQAWVTDYNPDYWSDVGVRAFTGEVYARPGPYGSGQYGSGPYGGLVLT